MVKASDDAKTFFKNPKVDLSKVKITVRKRPVYELIANDQVIGVFSKESEWNGLTELKGDGGMVIVSPADPFPAANSMLSGLFGDGDEPVEFDIVRASPEVMSRVLSKVKDDDESQ